MAQDYNIYLHSTTPIDEASDKTKPIVNRVEDTNIDGTTRDGSILDTFTKVKNNVSSFASSGFTGLLNQGISALGQVLPIVGVVYAVGKTIDNLVDTAVNSIAEYSGDYSFSIPFNNFKTGINNVMQPVSLAKNLLLTQLNIERQNRQIAQNRTLVGSATLRNTKIGV